MKADRGRKEMRTYRFESLGMENLGFVLDRREQLLKKHSDISKQANDQLKTDRKRNGKTINATVGIKEQKEESETITYVQLLDLGLELTKLPINRIPKRKTYEQSWRGRRTKRRISSNLKDKGGGKLLRLTPLRSSRPAGLAGRVCAALEYC
jgi:hypothetical protein